MLRVMAANSAKANMSVVLGSILITKGMPLPKLSFSQSPMVFYFAGSTACSCAYFLDMIFSQSIIAPKAATKITTPKIRNCGAFMVHRVYRRVLRFLRFPPFLVDFFALRFFMLVHCLFEKLFVIKAFQQYADKYQRP